ncbi:MAG: hypothetical protein E7067_00570 [Lentimicrobiaceae bacterium]|nr:hypothetical protein [Lentimicrobiaceae bacterium]
MRYKTVILISLLIAFMSCSNTDNSAVITRDFSEEQWSRFEYLQADFRVDRAPVEYDIVMEVVVSDIFPNVYEAHQEESTLSFNLTITNPNDDGFRSRNYNFNLKDKDGNWKAEKENGYYHYKLPIINDMTFSEEGIYKFQIENKYSKEPLYGIKSLTLKCIN